MPGTLISRTDDLRAVFELHGCKIKSGPKRCWKHRPGLTHQLDLGERGLAVKATSARARRACPTHIKHQLLRDQGYVCVYCAIPFGSVVSRRGRMRLTVVHFDHKIPFAYTSTNPDTNWAAACNICNGIKSSHIFATMSEAREYIQSRWEASRYTVDWVTPVSSEEFPERWAVKFGTFLARLPRGAGTVAYRKPWSATRRKLNGAAYQWTTHEAQRANGGDGR